MAPFPCKNTRETQELLRKETPWGDDSDQCLNVNFGSQIGGQIFSLDIILSWQHPLQNKSEAIKTFLKKI